MTETQRLVWCLSRPACAETCRIMTWMITRAVAVKCETLRAWGSNSYLSEFRWVLTSYIAVRLVKLKTYCWVTGRPPYIWLLRIFIPYSLTDWSQNIGKEIRLVGLWRNTENAFLIVILGYGSSSYGGTLNIRIIRLKCLLKCFLMKGWLRKTLIDIKFAAVWWMVVSALKPTHHFSVNRLQWHPSNLTMVTC